ncbi:hypothetical protein [Melaminivora sp.]|uniref:hypothetical protein n=1 Tax=Melaminivora sp. TaxID=1933032 RepID=UPI0028AD8CCA|nr:hypothetical protein [Melaminivora sp.]
MKAEHWTQDLRWRVGALVFAVLAAVGGLCALWALHDLRGSGARTAREDARALAQSVAQTLAQQLGRAARLGIPLEELPGVPAYLQAALQRQPALTRITVEQADGSVLHTVQGVRAPAHDGLTSVVRRPISGLPAQAGTVAVAADPAASIGALLRRARVQAAALVLGLALAAALAAALGPGARMERQRRRVLARLAGRAPARAHAPQPASTPRGLPALALALDQGDARLHEARKAVQTYARELLATDFDGRLRPSIERIVQDSGAELPAAPPVHGPDGKD